MLFLIQRITLFVTTVVTIELRRIVLVKKKNHLQR